MESIPICDLFGKLVAHWRSNPRYYGRLAPVAGRGAWQLPIGIVSAENSSLHDGLEMKKQNVLSMEGLNTYVYALRIHAQGSDLDFAFLASGCRTKLNVLLSST